MGGLLRYFNVKAPFGARPIWAPWAPWGPRGVPWDPRVGPWDPWALGDPWAPLEDPGRALGDPWVPPEDPGRALGDPWAPPGDPWGALGLIEHCLPRRLAAPVEP